MPMTVLYKLPHGQLGYSGHIVNLPQDVSTFASSCFKIRKCWPGCGEEIIDDVNGVCVCMSIVWYVRHVSACAKSCDSILKIMMH